MHKGSNRIGQQARTAQTSPRAATATQLVFVGRQLLLGLSGTLATISWLWLNAPPPL
jgi:hypothetical protein